MFDRSFVSQSGFLNTRTHQQQARRQGLGKKGQRDLKIKIAYLHCATREDNIRCLSQGRSLVEAFCIRLILVCLSDAIVFASVHPRKESCQRVEIAVMFQTNIQHLSRRLGPTGEAYRCYGSFHCTQEVKIMYKALLLYEIWLAFDTPVEEIAKPYSSPC